MLIGNNDEVSTHRNTPWIPWLAGFLAFVVTLGVGVMVLADWSLRTAEMSIVMARVELSEDAMATAVKEIDAAFEGHSQADATPEERSAFSTELKEIAERGRDAIAVEGANVATTPYMSWHTSIERAIDVYLAHNLAWQAYLDAASQDPGELLRPQPLVDSTFFDAELPLAQAIPFPDVLDLESRLAQIYAPPALDPSQMQQAHVLHTNGH